MLFDLKSARTRMMAAALLAAGLGLGMLGLLPSTAAAGEALTPPSSGVKGTPSKKQIVYRPYVDPDQGNIYFLPAARTLNKGQVAIALARPIGVGVYIGATDCLTIGIGGIPVIGFQAEIKYSIFKGIRHALSLWGFMHLPLMARIYHGSGDSGDYEDGGLMLAGGLLYSYSGDVFEAKLGLILYDFLMYDKYQTCSGGECSDETNWYHKWIMFSPYVELGVKVAKRLTLFTLLTTFDIRTSELSKEVVEGEVRVNEDHSFFWNDFFVSLGVRFFTRRVSLDAGLAMPIIPSRWGREGYPYLIPVVGVTWVY